MFQSQLFTKTKKESPRGEVSKNADLLVRAGYIHKEMAGVYSYLPLGLRVLNNLQNIIRAELNKIGAVELIMTSLQPKDIWEKTGRWDDKVVDDWFKTYLKNGNQLGLGFTHEEPLTNIMKDYIASYKDLPVYAYQFQTKFRNELRAKSGLMRGREFLMKDLYDFTKDKDEHDAFYEKMKTVYMNIFSKVGLGDKTYLTLSSGGSFSKYSYEFQTVCPAGEDTILYDHNHKLAINKGDYSEEIFKDFKLNRTDYNFTELKSIEIGDIYSLGHKYSQALGLTYKDQAGRDCPVYMGCYGIGVSRLMGAIIEVLSDDKGLVWPISVAPFKAHLIPLAKSANDEIIKRAVTVYDKLTAAGVAVLFDDRYDIRAGEKFAEADLLGLPYRIVLSEKTTNRIELKPRSESSPEFLSVSDLLARLS